jgi:hypothetical protein
MRRNRLTVPGYQAAIQAHLPVARQQLLIFGHHQLPGRLT